MNSICNVDQDKSTLSNPLVSQTKHVDWSVEVDFENCKFSATATYDIVITCTGSNRSIELDTRGLVIKSVIVDGQKNEWKLCDEIEGKAHLGQKLTIPISMENNPTDNKECHNVALIIKYETSPEPFKCTAAQWLTPAQTCGKKFPYLFTQCQAIHARSIIPCHDCPAVKMTYSASVTVPVWATAVMSAIQTTVETSDVSRDHHTFKFNQPIPIPAYLLALAVGELSSKDISPRCRVWSEPSILSAAASEFHQTESFLQTAEEITSMPYPWQRYDLLVLPSSFPYGGMENPQLTFVTPTLLAGDGSLVCVVAHEIAHSWTGNLVTNRTWGHFWLNEGWTTWLQRRIMNKVENVPHNMDLDAISGVKDLEEDMELLPKDMTKLVLTLDDGDPDESYSSVAYEKGFHLIYTLERMVGQEIFLKFVKAYLEKYAYGTITSDEFKVFCIAFWKDTNSDAYDKVKKFPWDLWFYGEGMPELPMFDKTLAEASESLASEWVAFDQDASSTKAKVPDRDIIGWTSAQKVCFLDAMLTSSDVRKLNLVTLSAMKETYGFHMSKNAEVLFRFCLLAVQSEDAEIYPIVVRFITSQGRMKYVRPLYRAMFQSTDKAKKIAIDTFMKNKDFYHPIAAKMIAMDMNVAARKDGSVFDNIKRKVIALFKDSALIPLAGIAVIVSISTMKVIKSSR
mmetsp:Transcript_12308/g.13860  ORF Transcript_12308/g.13860 Transcript_12308/m.13860 type:complete len:682 (+) Transcript_12308:97-2142(+)